MIMRKGFSLVEVLIVLALCAVCFGLLTFAVKGLAITNNIVKENAKYASITQISNNLMSLQNIISVKNDYINNKLLIQEPLLDSNNKIIEPIAGGKWYEIYCENQILIKKDMQSNEKVHLSPQDILIKTSTFDFDKYSNQIRITLDIVHVRDEGMPVRVTEIVNLPNILMDL